MNGDITGHKCLNVAVYARLWFVT